MIDNLGDVKNYTGETFKKPGHTEIVSNDVLASVTLFVNIIEPSMTTLTCSITKTMSTKLN